MNAPTPDPRWHWPTVDYPLCGATTDRERCGLPRHFISSWLVNAVSFALSRWRTTSIDGLLDVMSGVSQALPDRIACGSLLALCGDLRINTFAPQMLDVPGGEIEVGLSPANLDEVLSCYAGLGLHREWIMKECPRHQLAIKPFRIARYPVTNAEFREFLAATLYAEIPTSWILQQFPIERANHPVYTISATAANAYANWLSQCTGRTFRLPAEAEWEWAAAGPDGREFPWGNEFDAFLANTAESGLFNTSPVGAFSGGESYFGASDMGGNIEEYVLDEYAPYPQGEFVSDHLTQIHGRYRIARGGSFARFRDLARTRRRHGHNPHSMVYAMGFRLAEEIR